MESEDEQRPVLASDHPPKKITLHGYLNTLAPKHATGWFFYLVSPPKLSKYKIPLYPLAFRKISEELTRDVVLKKFFGEDQLKKTTLYIAA